MKGLNKLYQQLDQYKDFTQGENDQAFLEIVDQIVAYKRPESFGILIKYFNDDDRSWVLSSLVGTVIDYLDEETYTICFLKEFSCLFFNAENFCCDLFYPILLEKKCLNIFKKNMHLADKASLNKLFDLIYEESEDHRPIINELRIILNAK